MNENMERSCAGVTVVLPSLDPTQALAHVVDGLLETGFSDIVLVNDGSREENLPFFTEIQRRHPEVTLLTHPVNRGKGAALKTAFRWILDNRPDCAGVVTVDGDGQHHPEDTAACARQLLSSGHVVLGARDFSRPEVPPRSRMGNRITCGVFRVFVGMTVTDTQTGLRAIPRQYLETMCQVEGERFEYETNMLLALKDRHIPFDEVRIRTIYEENHSSHFQTVRDSWRIYKLIFAHFFRYILSSLVCAVVDAWLFTLLSSVLEWKLWGMAHTAVAAGGARLVSSLMNFGLNHSLVFRFTGRSGQALVRYYILVIVQYLAQLGLTQGLFWLLHISEEYSTVRHAVIYVIVMIALFVASYMIQQRWVFARPRPEARDESK